MNYRKRKKGLSKRRGNFNGLKITIEDNKGKASTYFVPVKKQRIALYNSNSIGQAQRTNRHKFWKIADNSLKINDLEELKGKKLVLKRGNARIAGVVCNVSCSSKSPEGGPVIPPPPPRP